MDTTDPDPGDTLSYTIWYSTESDFSVSTSSAGLGASSFTPGSSLIENVTYWWSVRAVDSDALQTVSDSTCTVVINGVDENPAVFNLVAPLNGTTVATRTPLFDWADTTDPDPGDTLSYTLYYSYAQDFSSVTAVSGIAVSSYTPGTSLLENNTYWWYVSAVDSDLLATGSATTNYFKINEINDPPGSFDIVAPADVSVSTALAVVFSWDETLDPDPGGSITYDVAYSTHVNFTSSTVLSGITATTTTQTLLDNSRYYWKVIAIDSTTLSTESDSTFRFDVNQSNDPPLSFDLVTPDVGEIVQVLQPTFVWNATADVDPGDTIKYKITYSVDPSLPPINSFVESNLDSVQYTPSDPLVNNTTYFWKVTAYDGLKRIRTKPGTSC